MITREEVLKQTEQAAQRAGRFRYLKKNAVTNLRILEYDNAQGNRVFAQLLVEHRRAGQGGKSIGICRREIFDLPCAFCRTNEMARDKGIDAPFISRSRYIMNALDIDNDPKTVRMYVVPTTVFSDVADFTLDEEWADVLEAKKGCAFGIGRKGERLDTEYTTKPQRKSYPIGKSIVEQVVDPLNEIRDPGVAAQCAEIGVDIEDLFEPDEIEEIKAAGEGKTKAGRGGKSAPRSGRTSKLAAPKFDIGDVVRYADEGGACEVTAIDGDNFEIKDENGALWNVAGSDLIAVEPDEPEPESIGLEIGAAIHYKDETDVCHISAIDPDKGTAEIEDPDGTFFDVEIDDLVAVEEAGPPVTKKSKKSKKKKAADDAPKCFGDPNLYDAGDDECKKCEYFDECGGNADLTKAGVGDNRTPAQQSRGKRSADDIVSDIIGSKRKR